MNLSDKNDLVAAIKQLADDADKSGHQAASVTLHTLCGAILSNSEYLLASMCHEFATAAMSGINQALKDRSAQKN